MQPTKPLFYKIHLIFSMKWNEASCVCYKIYLKFSVAGHIEKSRESNNKQAPSQDFEIPCCALFSLIIGLYAEKEHSTFTEVTGTYFYLGMLGDLKPSRMFAGQKLCLSLLVLKTQDFCLRQI